MKKYKLIKEYPGSSKLNTEFRYWTDGISEQVHNDKYGYIPLTIVHQYAEFWEEIIEKEYEILSFKDLEDGFLSTLRENGKYVYQHAKYTESLGATLECMLTHPSFKHYVIYSVKRISDNEVFTIGDKVSYILKGNIFTIKEIIIHEIMGLILDLGDNYGALEKYAFKSLIKLKKPLCISEDGIDLFVGDDFYVISKNCINTIINKTTLSYLASKEKANASGYLWFSSEEKAEEFILMNKPCLSLNDVASIYPGINKTHNTPSHQAERLKELVKTKI